MEQDSTERAVGRARIVLVSPNDGRAVVTTVVATAQPELAGEQRIRFSGDVIVQPEIIENARICVLPLIDHICQKLGIEPQSFEITVLNLNATSAKDTPTSLSGRSGEIALFLALFSAATGIPLRQDVLTTGQIASNTGDITFVSGIPAKAKAAAIDPNITLFLHPSLERDVSLQVLAPTERENIRGALAEASADVHIIPVNTIADVLDNILDDEAIALCSLRRGFFNRAVFHGNPADTLTQAVGHLTSFNDQRFWRALERALFSGNTVHSRDLLGAFIQFHVARKRYPAGFGTQLIQLLRSLPPAIRRLKTPSPPIPISEYISLSQYAGKQDYPDLKLLNDVCFYKARALESPRTEAEHLVTNKHTGAESAVDILFKELSSDAIAKTICQPIDEARARFTLESVQTSSTEECLEIATALYAQIQRYTKPGPVELPPETAQRQTLALLGEAFARYGGMEAAEFEACYPTRLGGMLYVLDRMAEEYKQKEIGSQVGLILKKAVDSVGDEKVVFMEELLRRLRPFLNMEDIELDVETLSSKWQILVQAIMQWLEAIKRIFKTR